MFRGSLPKTGKRVKVVPSEKVWGHHGAGGGSRYKRKTQPRNNPQEETASGTSKENDRLYTRGGEGPKTSRGLGDPNDKVRGEQAHDSKNGEHVHPTGKGVCNTNRRKKHTGRKGEILKYCKGEG